jgi:hypothetical protein
MNNYFFILIALLQLCAFIVCFIHKEWAIGVTQLAATIANIAMFFIKGKIGG